MKMGVLVRAGCLLLLLASPAMATCLEDLRDVARFVDSSAAPRGVTQDVLVHLRNAERHALSPDEPNAMMNAMTRLESAGKLIEKGHPGLVQAVRDDLTRRIAQVRDCFGSRPTETGTLQVFVEQEGSRVPNAEVYADEVPLGATDREGGLTVTVTTGYFDITARHGSAAWGSQLVTVEQDRLQQVHIALEGGKNSSLQATMRAKEAPDRVIPKRSDTLTLSIEDLYGKRVVPNHIYGVQVDVAGKQLDFTDASGIEGNEVVIRLQDLRRELDVYAAPWELSLTISSPDDKYHAVTLFLPGRYDVKGFITNPEAGKRDSLTLTATHRATGIVLSAPIEADGRFELRSLPEGSIDVRVEGEDENGGYVFGLAPVELFDDVDDLAIHLNDSGADVISMKSEGLPESRATSVVAMVGPGTITYSEIRCAVDVSVDERRMIERTKLRDRVLSLLVRLGAERTDVALTDKEVRDIQSEVRSGIEANAAAANQLRCTAVESLRILGQEPPPSTESLNCSVDEEDARKLASRLGPEDLQRILMQDHESSLLRAHEEMLVRQALIEKVELVLGENSRPFWEELFEEAVKFPIETYELNVEEVSP